MKNLYLKQTVIFSSVIFLLCLTLHLNAQTVPSDLMRNCDQWKITYPTGEEEKQLCGEANNEFFYVNPAEDGIVFKAPIRSDNGTTPNSSYIRSELRERTEDGDADIYWTTTGRHVLYVQQAITHLPIVKSHLVATQIHGNKADGIDDSMVMRLEDDHLFISFNGGKLREDVTIKTDYVLGTKHEVIFEVLDGKHYCYYSEDGNLLNAYQSGDASAYYVKDNGSEVLMDLDYDQTYFKVGNYTQSNPDREGDETDNPDNYGEVIVYDFLVEHGAPSGPVAVTGINLSPATATIAKDNTLQLSMTISPNHATDKGVSYSSNNTAIATVNSNGLITGISEGTAVITVTTDDGNYTATSTIKVEDVPEGLINITYNKPVTTSAVPDGENIGANLVDDNTDTRVSVQGYPQIFIIDLKGTYEMSYSELVFYDERAYQYTIATSTEKNGTYTTVVDRSNNTTASTISNPITDFFAATGSFIQITVTGADQYTGDWVSILEFKAFGKEMVEETIEVTGVSISPENVTLAIDETQLLTATVSPANADDQSVTYSSSNTDIATVSPNGLVTALAPGEVTITVTTNDGSYTASSTVVVTSPVVTSVEDIQHTALKLYPIPVANTLHYTLDNMQGFVFLEVYDITGKLVLSKVLQNSNGKIDVSPLTHGLYLVYIKGNTTIVERFVKK